MLDKFLACITATFRCFIDMPSSQSATENREYRFWGSYTLNKYAVIYEERCLVRNLYISRNVSRFI
ncbi:hypothetical protein [Pseudoalteromonas sp. MMG005]|uniref:hypothetical protein n=1 Tax=Pseudoalteromonas sp. MMG005 TaxID=2822682 RepID=UPI001B39DD0B|nr:hypothetical protein [Pseudoalteromonas sp. MMG005]MBQ4848469.1 hypothetical protein [Pseudoalteromonas sp. MMG005]